MKIADLNHLETVEANVTGGITNKYAKTVLSFKEYVDIDKYFTATANVKGNLAFAEADAAAFGNDSASNALTETYTDEYTSISTATSASATGKSYGYWY
ncbi:hypothetical protein [Lyngbya sp. PCC 8106]|uniref:hypothetical protein n=1 Tax=Lyngbya sp. (strain PCC 8106) TaxID=313612 RepID=UPI0000EA9EF2|nr:hypothetical protein [Lyngbya sp. PCC 8106]EAW36754.1 hypothetical protein L8106_29920 [Lyngbya sp. PCC 8106]